jgi:hypothetical protein
VRTGRRGVDTCCRDERHYAPEVRFSLWPLPAVFGVLCASVVTITQQVEPSFHWLNWYLAVVWSLYAPIAVVGILGALHLHRTSGGLVPRSRFSGTVDRKVVFVVPTLGRPESVNAL